MPPQLRSMTLFATTSYADLPSELRESYPIGALWNAPENRFVCNKFRIVRNRHSCIAIMGESESRCIRFKVSDPRVACVLYEIFRRLAAREPTLSDVDLKQRIASEAASYASAPAAAEHKRQRQDDRPLTCPWKQLRLASLRMEQSIARRFSLTSDCSSHMERVLTLFRSDRRCVGLSRSVQEVLDTIPS